MVELQWKVEGRHFRSQEEYMAALRDKQLIDSITANLKLDKPRDIEKLYQELKRGKYQFESIVGRQFDDNVYELYRQIKEEEAEKQKQEALRQEKKKQEKEKRKEALKTIGKPRSSTNGKPIRLEDFDKAMQQEILQELRRKEKKKKRIIAICIPVCVLCFGYFLLYYSDALKSNAEVADLIALKESAAESNTSYMKNNEVVIHRTEDSDADAPEILEEYKTLHNKNKKLIGWIKIDDTMIDYPVMQTVNNEYYLDHNFNQEEDRNGCIFMDYQCDVIKGCDNMILYGHHMQSGKMFGTLNKYSSENYYKEHPTIQFDTIYEKGQYEIMYVFRSKVYSEEEVTFKYYQFINAGSEQEFNSYMNEMSALSLYDTGVTATYGDKLLTLSTCDYQENDGRFVVVAKRVN